MLAGDHVFWVEVETTIDCKKKGAALRQSLLQMWRFRLFQDAVSRPAKTIKGKRFIVGRTIGDNGNVRDARLAIEGHGVLKNLRKRLAVAANTKNDHYVLFTVGKPKGPGGSGREYAESLEAERQALMKPAFDGLPELPAESCWYAY